MIPAALVGQLQRGLGDFLRASFASTTPAFANVIDDLLAAPGEVMKGPYVQLGLPFRKGSRPDYFPDVPLPFTPHLHQELAFNRLGGEHKRSTLVATGTGSGKTESFLYPILAHALAHAGKPGIKAILVYPMNALASDQALRLAKLIHGNDKLRGAVTAGLYVGEDEGEGRKAHGTMGPDHIVTDRKRLQKEPPDILLTNYKMLDYLLVRPRDRQLWQDSAGGSLRFLVVDELHTFDGAQGTDLACLIRRLKDRLRVRPGQLCCVGTSATLGSDASGDTLRQYAERVFSEPFDADSVITETRLDVDEFFSGEKPTFWTPLDVEDASRLDPANYSDHDAFVVQQAAWWLDGLVPAGNADAAWHVDLASALLRHGLLSAILDQLTAGPQTVDALVERLGGRLANTEDPAVRRAALLSFLALVSAARRWREELPAAFEKRELAGEARPTEAFLQVRIQLWQREMRRMVASVEERPRLRYSDDLTPTQLESHLPVIHCRECGVMGWGALVSKDKPWLYRVELQPFYRAFFANDARIHFLFPCAPEEDARINAIRRRFDKQTLTLVSRGQDIDEARAIELADVVQTRPNRRNRPELNRDCPFCGFPRSLSLLGFQAASLTSVFIDQLFASPFNDDKKLLTFSDSVQDAAHRAGFFGARTWRFNLRIAMQRVVDEIGEGLPLPELAGRVRDWWRSTGGFDEDAFIATFIAPDMLWLRDYERLREEGRLPSGSALPQLIFRRLTWEVYAEYGLHARVGRSLARTRCSTAHVDDARVEVVVDQLLEPVRNEIAGLRSLTREQLHRVLSGFLHHMQERGGILHDELPKPFWETESDFTFKHERCLPDGGRRPALLTNRPAGRHFDRLLGSNTKPTWYERWCEANMREVAPLTGQAADLVRMVLAGMVTGGLVEERTASQNFKVWGLRPEVLRVTAKVSALRCDRCGHVAAVAAASAAGLVGSPCLSAQCTGRMAVRPDVAPDYFARLYRSGNVARIFAEEHTGLLSRAKREDLEGRFKAAEKDRKPWFPNLLSSTPTLEMGIDIGDLSSAVLCSVPPAQANYLQRVGRAGRRDGNALVLTIANARNHDLYFYGEPEQMIAGAVAPPGVFLDATAVLERQLAAFCFDRWAASSPTDDALPREMRPVFGALENPAALKFPHDWSEYVRSHEHELVDDFLSLFAGSVEPPTADALRRSMRSEADGETLVAHRVLEAFAAEKKSVDELRKKVRRLVDLIKQLTAKPVKDEKDKEDLRELAREKAATQRLVSELDKRDPLGFLTDEGLLPNYAFPEAPIRLRSIIWRKKTTVQGDDGEVETVAYEYERPSAAALSELAPDNEFYASGRKVKIDQVDVSDLEPGPWRFCNECSHTEIDQAGQPPAPGCPACGSPLWPDPDQKHEVLKLRAVFANTNDRASRLTDDRDAREPTYYTRQTLIRFHDALPRDAWKLENDEIPFAFEFLPRATFRDVNFGKATSDGAATTIAGQKDVRRGFEVCKRCGKVQDGSGTPRHTFTCPARNAANLPVVECVYLYREFESEALRFLLPIPSFNTDRDLHSFTAAIQVGLRARFEGRVDHLRTMVMSEPVPNTPLRKQFLVLYDTVPGGTGYLKNLLRVDPTLKTPEGVRDVLHLARERLVKCTCASDPNRDGCYQCIYLYRHSNDMPETSRSAAIALLTRILDHWKPIVRVKSIGDVSVSGLLDSVLEARFLEALRRAGGDSVPSTVVKALVFGKPGWRWTIGDRTWNVEPQRNHAPGDGFGVGVSIDFLLHPATVAYGERPVAVFLDGWAFHKDRVAMDMLQRMSVQTSGKYDVWSFAWEDIAAALGEASTGKVEPAHLLFRDEGPLGKTLDALKVPHTVRSRLGETTWRWFVDTMAGAFAPVDAHRLAWATLFSQLAPLVNAAAWADALAPLPGEPRAWVEPNGGKHLALHWPADEDRRADILVYGDATIAKTDIDGFGKAASRAIRLVVVLHDDLDSAHEPRVHRTWAGLLRFANFLRPMRHSWFLGRRGMDALDYSKLAAMRNAGADVDASGGWSDLVAGVDPAARELLATLAAAGVPRPEVGVDLPDASGRALDAVAELAWTDARVAVVIDLPEGVVDRLAAGWRVFGLDDAVANVERLVTAIRQVHGEEGRR